MEAPTVYYDADCGLCSTSVRFVEARLLSAVRFVPLQSAKASDLLPAHRLNPHALDTLVLVEDGRAFLRSEAAIRVAGRLRWPWRAASALIVVPRPIRDAVYDFVARHRESVGGRPLCDAQAQQEVTVARLEDSDLGDGVATSADRFSSNSRGDRP